VLAQVSIPYADHALCVENGRMAGAA